MAKGEYTIIVARLADEMLLAHTEFISRVSTQAARKLISEFKKVKDRLADNPYQFPYADELDVPGISSKTHRKCLFYSRYKALFLIEGSCVYLDAIIDCRQENVDIFSGD